MTNRESFVEYCGICTETQGITRNNDIFEYTTLLKILRKLRKADLKKTEILI